MTYWTHDVILLAANNSGDSRRVYTEFRVPAGATLLRTIVHASISDLRLFDPGTGQKPIYPVRWALGDVNSDVIPHIDSVVGAGVYEGIPLIAQGQISVVYHPYVTISAYNADTVTPVAPLHGSITGAPFQGIAMYLSGSERVDSQAQRTFPGAHPQLQLTIEQLTSGIEHDGQAPMTVFSIRHLWNQGSF